MNAGVRIGVRGRLFTAFAGVAALALVASAAGWYAYARLTESLTEMTGRHIPALGVSIRLAEQGSAIVATAPVLAAAASEKEVDALEADLDRRLAELRVAARELAGDGDGELNDLIGALTTNSDAITDKVRERLRVAAANAAEMKRLTWLHADFLDEVEPLTVDMSFNMNTALDALEGATKADATRLLEVLRSGGAKNAAIQQLHAHGNLAVGLIGRAANASGDSLAEAVTFLAETVATLERDLAALADLPDTLTIRQVVASIIEATRSETGPVGLRRTELSLTGEIAGLLGDNRALVARLQEAMRRHIAAIDARAASAGASAVDDARRGKALLIALALATLVGAVLVGWFYVGRSLVARLLDLTRAAKAIAAGDLRAPVPVGGDDDEIAEMAKALRVFRDTAQAVEDANAQAIIENAEAGLVMLDADGAIAFVTPLAEGLIAGAAMRLTERLKPADAAAALAEYLAAARDPDAPPARPLVIMARGARPDGAEVPLLVAVRPFQRRRQRHFLVTLTDMTERLEAERILEQAVAERTADLTRALAELRETQDELIQAGKLAALGHLAAGIGHELNQPLAAIRSYAHNARVMLSRERRDGADENLGRILGLTGRMADIVNHLKRFARRPGARLGPVSVSAAIGDAVALFGNRFRDETIGLVVEVAADCPPVRAEEVRLEQILVNLLSNAIDAVRAGARRQIAVSAAPRDGLVAIEVADSGPGISADDPAMVFDPFYTTKEPGAGTGLGLSISYNIARDFGGNLVVASSSDGARFTLTIPAA